MVSLLPGSLTLWPGSQGPGSGLGLQRPLPWLPGASSSLEAFGWGPGCEESSSNISGFSSISRIRGGMGPGISIFRVIARSAPAVGSRGEVQVGRGVSACPRSPAFFSLLAGSRDIAPRQPAASHPRPLAFLCQSWSAVLWTIYNNRKLWGLGHGSPSGAHTSPCSSRISVQALVAWEGAPARGLGGVTSMTSPLGA